MMFRKFAMFVLLGFFFLGGAAQNVSIIDANFKKYLLDNPLINTNGDSEIQESEAAVFDGRIDVRHLGISNLVGIEAFTSLAVLNCDSNFITNIGDVVNAQLVEFTCSNNAIASLDVSSAQQLQLLDCSSNSLRQIDVSANVALKKLDCSHNNFLGLNVQSNLMLEELHCDSNFISSLEFENNVLLTNVTCSANGIGQLSLESNINLEVLDCSENSFVELDVSKNSLLRALDCSNNFMAALDLSRNPKLSNLICCDNRIGNLNLTANTELVVLDCSSNRLESVDLRNGNNEKLITFDGRNNFRLICFNVSNVEHAHTVWGKVDAGVVFSEACRLLPVVPIADASFKNYLLGKAEVNRNGDDEIQVNEAEVFSGVFEIDDKGITDLSGIEYFVRLTGLSCMKNSLTSIDVSANQELRFLLCYDNQLVGLDVSENTLLQWLDCGKNRIVSLDLKSNIELTSFSCDHSTLASLDIRNGNNRNISWFVIADNPDLSCVSVDDTNFSMANWTNVDEGVVFNENCALNTSVGELESTYLQSFPNPTKGKVTFESDELPGATLQVFDISGNELVSNVAEDCSISVDLSGFSDGVYFVLLTHNGEVLAREKVIKK